MSAKNLASVIKCQKGVKINSVTCRAQLCQKPRRGLTLALTVPDDIYARQLYGERFVAVLVQVLAIGPPQCLRPLGAKDSSSRRHGGGISPVTSTTVTVLLSPPFRLLSSFFCTA